MNASLWQLAGWTMIHSLWLGAAVALAGGFLRLACRRATPNTRYAISLATLTLLAATPIAASGWLSINGVPQLAAISPSPRYSGERLGEGLNRQGTLPSRNAGATNENPFLAPPLPGTDLSDLQSSTSQIIDLANPNSSPQPSGTWSGEGFAALPATPHAKVTIENPSPTSSLPPSTLPLHPSDHQSPITSHLSTLIPYLPTLWLIGAPLTFTLLATGLVGSERLRRRATPLTAGPAFDACQRLRQTLTITRRVALAVCDDVAQPILVGIVRPLILLPTAALAGWTPEQLDMVLLHELAHVRRWDNLVNLLQRIVESLLFFHPAVWLVSRQVRRDREECCDAAVIRHTDRPHQYAELLVSIAAALRGGPAPSLAVASAMASHPLAGRIRRILNIEAEPMRITRRTLAATLLLPLLLAGAIFYSGASAEDTPSAKEQSSEVDAKDDATESPSLNNAENPSEASARAKLIDDKLEEGSAAVRTVYPIPPGTLVDPIELAKAIQSRHPVEIAWAEHQQGIIVSAPQDVHERVAALIKKSAAKTAKFTDDTFKPIMAHNLVDGDNAPLIGGYGILEEFAADADPSTIDATIERLKAEKRSFSVEQSDNGSKRIVDQTPPSKKPTIAMPLITKEAPTQDKHLQELFTATYVNPVIARKYRVPPDVRQPLEDMFDGLEKDPYGPQISFHRVWSGDDGTVEITAPTEAHLQYFDLIFGVLSLQDLYRQQAASESSTTTDNNPGQADLRTVLAESKRRLERQLADLKGGGVEAEGIEAETAAITALEAKVLEWEVMSRARGALRNQRAAATESSASDVQPTAETSPAASHARAASSNGAARFHHASYATNGGKPEGFSALASNAKNEFNASVTWDEPFTTLHVYGPDLIHARIQLYLHRLSTKNAPPLPRDPSGPFGGRPGDEGPQVSYLLRKGSRSIVEQWLAEHPDSGVAFHLTDPNNAPTLVARGAKDAHQQLKAALLNLGILVSINGELGEPLVSKSYSTDDVRLVNATEFSQALGGTAEILWDTVKRKLTVRAPERIHAQIAKLLNHPGEPSSNSQRPGSKIYASLPPNSGEDAVLRAMQLQERDGSDVIAVPHQDGSYSIVEKTPEASAARKQLLESMTRPGNVPPITSNSGWSRQPTSPFGQSKQGDPDSVPLAHKPETPANDRPNAPVDSANAAEQEAEKLRRLFQESASNEQITKFYAVPQGSRQELETAIGVAAGKLFGSDKPPFHLKWEPDEDALYVTAPQLAHRGYFHVVFVAHKLKQPGHTLPEYQATLAELEKANADAARAMAGLPPAHLPPSPFPTLENQKIADRAYKLLGLELEPLTPEELERVKKLGYNGGLRVVAVDPHKKNGIGLDALLVGLHVWPITDLQSLDAVLTREDLDDLSPLRFRTVVKASDSPLKQPEDRVISGRMPIDVEAFRAIQQSLPPTHPNAAQSPNGPIPPADSVPPVTVIQSPVSSISGPTKNHTRTTAYLKISFNRLPGAFNPALSPFGDAATRLTPQEIERQTMNCLSLVKNPAVMKAALNSFTPRDAQDLSQDQAVLWLLDRLSCTFPGDGEIMELKLEGGDAKEDSVLLQAVIDAFLAAMKASPDADPNAAATVPPGDLSPYTGRDANVAPAPAGTAYPEAFDAALEQSRKAGKPVVVHFLAHNSEPSQRFVDEVLANEQVVKFIDEHFIPITIYADDEPAFAKKFRVSRVPSNVFVFNSGTRTGGVAVQGTPAAYIAQLQQMDNIATNPANTAIQGEPIPATPPVPVADRPDGDNQSFERPPSHVEGLKLVKEFPATINRDELKAIVEGYRQEGNDVWVERVYASGAFRVLVAAKAGAGKPVAQQPTFLYDGKTFDQWRDLWKLELNPERRIEAINAMAAFSRAGRGDEALNAILDVAAEYDFSTIDPDDAEGKLAERIIKLFTDYPGAGAYQDPWLPIVLDRMQAAPDKWRPLVEILLYQCGPPNRMQFNGPPVMSAANVELLKKAASDERLNAKVLFLTTLNNVAAHDPDVIRMSKETLQSDDTKSSLNLLGGIRFANIDELPEQLEFLFAVEPATRQTAREILSRSVGPQGRDAVADKLLAILNDPNQSARHADAIRALAMFSKSAGPTAYGYGLSKDKKREVHDSLRRIVEEGPIELFVPATVASELFFDNPDQSRDNLNKSLTDERKKLLEESTQELADEKELLFKGTALGERRGF